MRLVIRILGLEIIDVDWTTDTNDANDAPVGDTGTPLTIGFQPLVEREGGATDVQ